MDPKTSAQLEKARAYYNSLHLVEAYNIFRRFFDRLPFKPEKEHADCIAMFARTLVELGKERELVFYLGELERLQEKLATPSVSYQLAVVYCYLPEPRWDALKKLLDEIIRDPHAREYHAKAKMLLAVYYDRTSNDVGMCRRLIDSIEGPLDENDALLVQVWKAKVLRDEKKFGPAEVLLNSLLAKVDATTQWHFTVSARVILGNLYVRTGRMEEATAILRGLKSSFGVRHFKSVNAQFQFLEEEIERHSTLGTIKVVAGEKESTCTYAEKTLFLKEDSPSERLLLLLLKKKFLTKSNIVKSLYNRQYSSAQDDKLIYYHIHSLRKRLRTVGLPGEAILSESEGYRFVPEVEVLGETSDV
jgi:hypothetical protein